MRVSGDKSPSRGVYLEWFAQPCGILSSRHLLVNKREREGFFLSRQADPELHASRREGTCHFLIEPTVHSDPPSVSDHIHRGPTVPAPHPACL